MKTFLISALAVMAIGLIGCGSDDVASSPAIQSVADVLDVAGSPDVVITPVVVDASVIVDNPVVADTPVVENTQSAAASELFERMSIKMAEVDAYRFDILIVGPSPAAAVIGGARGTWARPDRRRIDFLDRNGEAYREVIRTGDQEFFRAVGEEIWRKSIEYEERDSLEHGDISGLGTTEVRPWECEAPYEQSTDRACVLAVVDIEGPEDGQSAIFGRVYLFDIDNEDFRLLRWIRFDGGRTLGENLSEFLERDPELEFKSIGRLIFEYSDHDAPVSDDIFLPEPLGSE